MDPMIEPIPCVLVGGPHDGAEYLVARRTLHTGSIRTADVTPTLEPRVPTINEYRIRLVDGHEVRSESGRIIFEFVGSIY